MSPEMIHTDCPLCDAPRWRPLQLNDDVRRVGDCIRACFADDMFVRYGARMDWIAFATCCAMAIGAGFAAGAWLTAWLR